MIVLHKLKLIVSNSMQLYIKYLFDIIIIMEIKKVSFIKCKLKIFLTP